MNFSEGRKCHEESIFGFRFLAVFILAGTPVFAQKAITLSLGHIMSPETHQGVALDYLAKLVKEKTKGNVEVKIYP